MSQFISNINVIKERIFIISRCYVRICKWTIRMCNNHRCRYYRYQSKKTSRLYCTDHGKIGLQIL